MTNLRLPISHLLMAQRGYSATRMFSGLTCEPAERLRGALSEYRKENYSREIPSRFKKEILQPYIGANGKVQIDQVNSLLTNIGHEQDCLSPREQTEFLQAAGSKDNQSITVTKMMELID